LAFRKKRNVRDVLYFYYYTNELSYLQLISFSASPRIISGCRAGTAFTLKPLIPK